MWVKVGFRTSSQPDCFLEKQSTLPAKETSSPPPPAHCLTGAAKSRNCPYEKKKRKKKKKKNALGQKKRSGYLPFSWPRRTRGRSSFASNPGFVLICSRIIGQDFGAKSILSASARGRLPLSFRWQEARAEVFPRPGFHVHVGPPSTPISLGIFLNVRQFVQPPYMLSVNMRGKALSVAASSASSQLASNRGEGN